MTTTPLPPLPEPEGQRLVDLTPAVYAMWERQMKAYAFAARADLEAEVQRLREALQNLADEFVRVYPIYYYAEPWAHKTNAPLLAARAALEGKP